MILLTDAALDQVRRLRLKAKNDALMLRLGVKNAGCAGMSYDMKLDGQTQPEDQVLAYGDLTVVIDPVSLPYLQDLTLDYSADLMGGGFRFRNPNATHTCGCGSSFTTAPQAVTP